MAERYAIVNLLQKNKEGLTFKILKRELRIKESRLQLRLAELEDRWYISVYKTGNVVRYINQFREE